VPVAPHVTASEAALAEPLAVALHAVSRAGPLLGGRVLVAGSGPIGALLVAAARRAGAGEIVATDILAAPLAFALRMGADEAIDVAAEPERLETYVAEKGCFDVMFEASGSAAAITAGLDALGPRASWSASDRARAPSSWCRASSSRRSRSAAPSASMRSSPPRSASSGGA